MIVRWEFIFYEKMSQESEEEYWRRVEEEVREETERNGLLKRYSLREWVNRTYRDKWGVLKPRRRWQERAVLIADGIGHSAMRVIKGQSGANKLDSIATEALRDRMATAEKLIEALRRRRR